MANRQKFTRAVANEIAERDRSPTGEPWCAWCFCLTRKRELHHVTQDAMKRPEDKRRRLTAADGVMLCIPCHRGESAIQAVDFNKAERVRARHNGVERPTARPLRSRGFAKVERTRPPPAKICPRRPLFIPRNAP